MLETLDRQLFLFLNQLGHPHLDSVMWYISTITPWIPLFLFFFYYAYKKNKWKLVLLLFVGLACCVLLADRISVMAFKDVFQRYRPTHNLDITDMVKTVIKPNGERYYGGQYGFVSSHSANFFAITTFLVLMFKEYTKKWYWLFLWASLIAYSRIYLGVHYPSDIIAGGILGISIGLIVYGLTLGLNKKFIHV